MPFKNFVFKFFLLPKNEEKGENKPIFALQLLSFCVAPKLTSHIYLSLYCPVVRGLKIQS